MRHFAPFLVVLSLIAAACGGGSETSVSAAGGGDGPASFEDLDFRSPIGDFLGTDFNNRDNMEEEFAEMEREAGRLTAECMAEKGFEYSPRDMGGIVSFGPGGDEIPYFSDEWVDKYGFGITTQRFPQSSVGELAGYPDESRQAPTQEIEDPNQEYVESLTEGEREAYQEALYGLPPDFGEEGPGEDFEFEPTGCQNVAFETAFNGGPGGGQAFFEAFGDELEAMQERALADPRVIEFNNKVSDCVNEKGEVWVDQQELYTRFEQRLEAIQPRAFMSGDPFEDSGLDPEEMSEREIQEYFENLDRLDPENIPVLAELQAEELALARIVVDCGGGPLNEQVVLMDVRIELEQAFLDANADRLAEFKPDN